MYNMLQGSKWRNGNPKPCCQHPFLHVGRCSFWHIKSLSGKCGATVAAAVDWTVLQQRLDQLGIHLSSSACRAVLHLYKKSKSPPFGKQIHNRIVESAGDLDKCLDSLLVYMCIKNEALNKAQTLASKLGHVSVLVWNCLIGAYAQQGKTKAALQVLEKMQEKGLFPDKVTFLNAFSACNSPDALTKGKALHDLIIFIGCEIDVVVGTSLVTMYSKCGSIEDAWKTFDGIENCNVVTWTAMIGAYASHEQAAEAFHLFDQMKQEGMMPNRVTFLCLLEACSCEKALAKGRQLHCQSVSGGLESDMNLMTALGNMYGKCGSLEDAQQVFNMLSPRDVVLWNAIIAASVRHKQDNKALQHFDAMQHEGVIPNLVTYVTVLSACAHDTSRNGKRMHTHIICSGLKDNVFVATALINMYGKSGRLEYASCLFDNMKEQNVVAWNTIIAIYAQHRHAEDVLHLLDRMQHQGVFANKVTYVSALEAYVNYKALPAGKRMHCRIANSGFETDTVVATALASMYCRCDNLENAWRVFNEMPDKNVISWNTMVSACGKHGSGMQAFNFYKQMRWEGVNPDHVTYTSLLSICANQLALLTLGNYIHSCIMYNAFEPDIVVATSLLNMYGKCGSLQDASKMFERMSKRNVVSWNVMISTYAQHGHAREAIHLIDRMQQEGVIPNNVTFISILSACSHTGLLVEGYCNLLSMHIHGIRLSMEQYHCMIDLLGRAGLVDEAEDLIYKMPLEPCAISWMTLLGACKNLVDVERGEHIAKHVFELDPSNTAAYTMVASIYIAAEKNKDVEKSMDENRDRKSSSLVASGGS